VRIGVVGCGYWGSKHVRVLESFEDVQSVVAIDSRAERCTTLQRSFPRVATYSDLESAMDAVDAVVVATPPSSHAAIALTALWAGKNVLVEKPLTTRVCDARKLVQTAEDTGLTLMVGHTFEYNAAVRKLQNIVWNKELGELYYIHAARLNLGLYQSDVNVLWDLAPHDISITNSIVGRKPTSVQAWGASHAHAHLEDVAYLRLRYDVPEVTVQIHVSWLDPCKVRQVTVVGREKMAVYNDLADEERIRIYDKGVVPREAPDLHSVPTSYRYGGIHAPYIDFQEPLQTQDRDFVDSCRLGKQPVAHARSGLAVVEVLEAAQESLREGAAVTLEPETTESSSPRLGVA